MHYRYSLLNFTAFPSSPILSADEEFLYLAGASASVLCVSTVDGSNVWSFVTDGLHAAQPVLSEIEGEDPVLYTIEVRIWMLGHES
jgi:outer membrane protein assembly factor BamB